MRNGLSQEMTRQHRLVDDLLAMKQIRAACHTANGNLYYRLQNTLRKTNAPLEHSISVMKL